MIERYQTPEMAAVWNDEARFSRWTRVEIAACNVWHQRNEITDPEIAAIRAGYHGSAQRIQEIEATTHHDVVAFVRSLSESVGQPAARHLHRGLTSSDVVDTALALAVVESLEHVQTALGALQRVIAARAYEFKSTPCVGRTHGIHAEPTTFGLRLAGWHAELGRHRERVEHARQNISVGKLSGAVGNFSQTDPEFEAAVMDELGLAAEPVATQVVPRDRHAEVLSAVALLGAGLERFATEIRSLQRTELREAEEPFGSGQTGSSAMPHKRNPILSERVCGMARVLRGYLLTGLENVSLWHERDISHSSVERIIFPDAFHTIHYMLRTLRRVVEGWRVYPEQMRANLDRTGGLVFSQNVLGVLLASGLDRQEAYAVVQRAAMSVWEGTHPDLQTALGAEASLKGRVQPEQLAKAFSLAEYRRHVDEIFCRAGLGGHECQH